MVKSGKEIIVEELEKAGFNVSKQALEFLDMLGRDNDKEFVNEFVEWYNLQYAKNIGGGDVLNFVMQRKEFLAKKVAGKLEELKLKPEEKDR